MAEVATSSKPITEHCSGTAIPAFVRARMAPKALMSSKASRAVNERFWRMSSSVSLQPDSKLERGSRDSGRSRMRRASSSRPDCFAKFRMPPPARRTIRQAFGAADKGNLAMSQGVQVLESQLAADFVVDDDRTHGVVFQFAADHGNGDAAFFQVGEQIDIEKEPVGNDDQSFDAAVQQHFQVALEAAALVVDVGQDGQVVRLVERVFDAAKNQGAEGVGHVEDHDTDGVAALAAQGTRELVGTIAELLRGALDAFLGDGGNIARQGRVVEDDGHGGRGKTAFLRHVTNGHHAGALQRTEELRCFRISLFIRTGTA